MDKLLPKSIGRPSSQSDPGHRPRRRVSLVRGAVYTVVFCAFAWVLFSGFGSRNSVGGDVDLMWEDWSAVQEIFAFGDSWTTTDFDVEGHQPDESNPMGNPDLSFDPHGRLPHWIEYLTATYNSSFIRTYNLARGAATIDRDLNPPVFALTQTLHEQVEFAYALKYAQNAHPSDPWPPKNRLGIIFAGLVDISLLTRNGTADPVIIEGLARSYEGALHQLYDNGMRHLVLLNTPPLDMAPSAINVDVLSAMLVAFNARLRTLANSFRRARPDVALRVLDVYGLLAALIRDPASLPQTAGLRNTTEACWNYDPDMYIGNPQSWTHFDPACGIPRDEYFWANLLHPTHPVQEAIAAMIVGECFETTPQPPGGKRRSGRKRGWGLCN